MTFRRDVLNAKDAQRGKQIVASGKYTPATDRFGVNGAELEIDTTPPSDIDSMTKAQENVVESTTDEWEPQPDDDPHGDRAHETADNEWPELLRRKPFRDQLLSVTDLSRLPAVEPLVDGLLFRNTLAQLCGPPGSYKSFISLNLSCALASGQGHWEGHRIPTREKVI